MKIVNWIDKNYLYEEKAILVYIVIPPLDKTDWNVQEFQSLAESAKIKSINIIINKIKKINSKYFVGTGKVLELYHIIKNSSASMILFSCILSPNQERNLTFFLKCKVMDRNQLILSIFAQRARTYEGKLQVKLAQLRYLNSRLTHEWSHLERQKGGIGMRGGPGEMQLESDRRLLRKKIIQISSDLKKIENQRKQNRCRRIKLGVPIVSLIGYTNAGKSTVFNLMTLSNVDTSKKFFSTLDPTFRRIIHQKKINIVLVDTVGFIKNLPKDLLTSFKSTLQEIMQSTLLLHVIDISNDQFEENINAVNYILNEINVIDIPILLIMNKIDQLDKTIKPHIDRDHNGCPTKVWISAKKNIGIDLLKESIDELLLNNIIRYKLRIPIYSDIYKQLYRLKVIEKYKYEDKNTVNLEICLSSENWKRLIKHHKLLLDYVI